LPFHSRNSNYPTSFGVSQTHSFIFSAVKQRPDSPLFSLANSRTDILRHQWFQFLSNFEPLNWIEAIANFRYKSQFRTVVITDHDRVESAPARRETADYKFLACVDPVLNPQPRAPPTGTSLLFLVAIVLTIVALVWSRQKWKAFGLILLAMFVGMLAAKGE
jgi:hypothetical protein